MYYVKQSTCIIGHCSVKYTIQMGHVDNYCTLKNYVSILSGHFTK